MVYNHLQFSENLLYQNHSSFINSTILIVSVPRLALHPIFKKTKVNNWGKCINSRHDQHKKRTTFTSTVSTHAGSAFFLLSFLIEIKSCTLLPPASCPLQNSQVLSAQPQTGGRVTPAKIPDLELGRHDSAGRGQGTTAGRRKWPQRYLR